MTGPASQNVAIPDRVWAKGKPQTAEAPWHPLDAHLADVAAVAEALWTSALPTETKRWFATGLGLPPGQAGAWVAFWAGLHDIGKASPVFQARESFSIPKPTPHGVVSAHVLRSLLTDPPFALDSTLASMVADAVGGHHGTFASSKEIGGVRGPHRGSESWQALRARLAADLAAALGADGLYPPTALDPVRAAWLAGLVSVADWIGSNATYFDFAASNGVLPAGHSLAARLAHARTQAEKALRELGWLARPTAVVALNPKTLVGHEPNALQLACADLAAGPGWPGIVIVEAPMGEGKTEAAYLLASRGADPGGFYVAMPTQATSNQMFGRTVGFLGRRHPGETFNVHLLHGAADLSDLYGELQDREIPILDGAFRVSDGEADGDAGGAVAAEWFTHRKRGLLAPFGVGTVDQALLAALRTRHVCVRLFGLAGKTVIVDEVHAYDAYMSHLLERLLEWLAALGCSVVLLSATLPAARRAALLAAYEQGRGGEPPAEPPAVAYPRITAMLGGTAAAVHVAASPKAVRRVRLTTRPASEGRALGLGPDLRERLAEGGCAVVVCTTVARAQAVYQDLLPYFPGDAHDGEPVLDLLHARFLRKDRAVREERCLRRFGPVGGEGVRRPDRAVLVATQIVEQSLDLDFDLMVSELAPADLVLQRSGRLHRHPRPRPAPLCEPELVLVLPEEQDGAPLLARDATHVYDAHILLRSWLELRGREAIAVPGEIEGIVELVYAEQDDAPAVASARLRERWAATLAAQRQKQQAAKEAAKTRLVPVPFNDDLLPEEMTAQSLAEDDPNVRSAFLAMTRLTEPSVELALLSDGQTLPARPSQDDLRRWRDSSVSLPGRRVVETIDAAADDVVRCSRTGPHRLYRCMLLGSSGTAVVGDLRLTLDRQLGIVVDWPSREESDT